MAKKSLASQKNKKWLTVAEYAQKSGVDKKAVGVRTRSAKYLPHTKKIDGLIHVDAEAYDRLSPKSDNEMTKRVMNAKQVDKKKSLKKRQKKLTDAAAASLPLDGDGVYVDYMNEKRKWAAHIEKLKYEKLTGSLISSSAVRSETFSVARLARDQLLAIPDRVCGQLVGIKTVGEAFKILNTEIVRVLDELVDALNKMEFSDNDEIPEEEEDADDV